MAKGQDYICWRPGEGPPPIPITPRPEQKYDPDPKPEKEVSDFIKRLYPDLFK